MFRVLLAVAAALALGGCAVFDQISTDWFGGEAATPTPTPQQQGESFYSSGDGLAMHFLPSGSSQVVGRLALHEHVTRTDLQRGYAHVKDETSGDEVWSNWRKTSTGACVVVHFDKQRTVTSIVKAPQADCS